MEQTELLQSQSDKEFEPKTRPKAVNFGDIAEEPRPARTYSKFSDFAEAEDSGGLKGVKKPISEIFNKEVLFTDYKIIKSK